MNISMTRRLAAVLALLFIVVACASDTGAQWTFAPVAVSEDAPADASPTVGDDEVPVEAGDALPPGPADPETPAEGADPAMEPDPAADPDSATGEARVIEMHATGALQFTTPEGEQIRDIAVTPGETILFRVDNTAGFDHNFYIGTDEQLVAPGATTDVGIPTWQTGVQELEWTVPDDISGLKFGCTVPGHYTLMQGTFSVLG